MVSVIMTVFNGEKYLESAITSILRQSYRNFELIVINDGSTDSTNKIVTRFSDPRIKYLKNFENKGQSYSRNRGVKSAKGKYIAIMDADDIAHPVRLEKQVDYLEKHPEISLCGSWAEIIDEAGNLKDVRKIPQANADIKLRLLFGCPIIHPTVMWRKLDFLSHNLWYDERFTYAQDFDLWTRAMFHLDFHVLEEPLLRFRFRNKNSISYAKVKQQTEFAKKIVNRNIMNITGMSFKSNGSLLYRLKLYRLIVRSSFLNDDQFTKVMFFRNKILQGRKMPYKLKFLIRRLLIH